MKKVLMLMILIIGVGVSSFAHSVAPVKGENVFDHLHKGEKKALLVVHFGTTVEETREKTIDSINNEFKEEFKGFEVREAFTSREIIRKLDAQGIKKENPMEALDRLAAEGYTHILVQMTNVINGVETENLQNEITKHSNDFEVIRVGTPLLTDLGNYQAVAKAIKKEIPVSNDTAVVVVGHGTHHYAGAAYAKMDYVFKNMGYDNYFVGTVEGYPALSDVKKQLEAKGYKKVVLAPFMFVAGDHAVNDIAGDWKEELDGAGYNVELAIKGLGEYADIQHIYVDSAYRAMVTEPEDMAAKKAKLAKK